MDLPYVGLELLEELKQLTKASLKAIHLPNGSHWLTTWWSLTSCAPSLHEQRNSRLLCRTCLDLQRDLVELKETVSNHSPDVDEGLDFKVTLLKRGVDQEVDWTWKNNGRLEMGL